MVGAGVGGLTTAYLLAAEGQAVVVLDDGAISGGETSRTTAHLVTVLDDRYFELDRMHGEKGVRLAAESHSAIACDFERLDGYLFLPPGESTDVIEKELKAALRAGLAGVERVDRAPCRASDTGACLRFPRQAQFHPLKYMNALAEAIERNGGRIFNNTHAEEFKSGTRGPQDGPSR